MIVLDTHAWIWWVTESISLSIPARNTIENANMIGIPAICCWELAMLVAKQRIGLNMDIDVWLKLALQRPKV